MDGHGVLTWKDGKKYEGNFVNDKRGLINFTKDLNDSRRTAFTFVVYHFFFLRVKCEITF